MTKGLMLGLIILAVSAMSLWYLIQNDQIPNPNDQTNPKAQSPKAIPAEFQSGNSRFSQGSCTADVDCTVGGCSGEVCGSDPGVITTCEFSPSFPGVKRGYACGCLPTKVCGWR